MERSFRTRSALSRYFQGALLGLAYFIFDGIGAYLPCRSFWTLRSILQRF